ncbi:DUF4406 domain-containing protein [Streptomyces sp. NPDC001455]|uniref:DUF4406 domain-containing protein n=1 Tax=Streptomyces sp. NPDC001455 TaxID=3154518 RepID=UPI00331FED57
MTDRPTLILIAGPYRSGVDGKPRAMAASVARLEAAADPVFAAGHVPVRGEWIVPPVLRSAGAGPTDPLRDQVLHPASERLSAHCDAALRPPGDSIGAEQDIATARRRGLPIHHHVNEIPRHTLKETA